MKIIIIIALCILGWNHVTVSDATALKLQSNLKVYPYCTDVNDPKIDCSQKYPNGTYINGNRPNPYEPCSNIFFMCSNGRSYCYNCQINPDTKEPLYYNHPILECDYKQNVQACTGAPEPTTIPTTARTTPTTKPITTPTTPAGYKCPFGDGFWPINEGVCSGDYYSCILGTPYVLSCPSGSLFDPFLRICVKESLATCNYKCPAQDGFYPVPGYENNYCMNSFIHCILKIAYPGSCPGTAVFNPDLLYCVAGNQCNKMD